MFIAALFRIANIWKQPKCPSRDEWIKKKWYIYVCVYIIRLNIITQPQKIKNNEILSFAARWVDLEITILSEVRQSKTNII